jgi:hypothetical protein
MDPLTPTEERRELRYSASHEGYFWEIWIPNPAPLLMPDGTPNVLDEHLVETGFTRRRPRAERQMRRAERRIRRKIAKIPEDQ